MHYRWPKCSFQTTPDFSVAIELAEEVSNLVGRSSPEESCDMILICQFGGFSLTIDGDGRGADWPRFGNGQGLIEPRDKGGFTITINLKHVLRFRSEFPNPHEFGKFVRGYIDFVAAHEVGESFFWDHSTVPHLPSNKESQREDFCDFFATRLLYSPGFATALYFQSKKSKGQDLALLAAAHRVNQRR